MKFTHLLIALIILSVGSLSYSQSALDKGNHQLAGSVSYMQGKTNNDYFSDKYMDIELSPQYSYFVIDNLLIGGLISFNYNEYEWTSPEHYFSVGRMLGVGPLVKYYFRTESVIPFVGASATYTKYLGEDGYGYEVNLSTGVDYFIAKSLALEPFVQYKLSNDYKPDSDSKSFSFGLRLNYFIVN